MSNRGLSVVAGVLLLVIGAGCAGKSPELASGIIYLRQEDYTKAAEILEKAVEVEPENWEAHFQLAIAYSLLERYSDAFPAFQKAREFAGPRAAEVEQKHYAFWYDHFAVGETERKARNYEKAEKEFLTAIDVDPTRIEAYSNLAFTYHKMGEIEKSLDMYDRVVEIDPDNADALDATASVLMELKRYEDAITTLKRLLEIDPERHECLIDIGDCYKELGDNDHALQYYLLAREAMPDEAGIAFAIGVLYYKDENFAEAAEYFLQTAEVSDPTGGLYRDALFNRAQMQARIEDYQGALATGLKLIEVKHDAPEYYDLIGRIYYKLGDTENGTRMFEKAKELEGS